MINVMSDIMVGVFVHLDITSKIYQYIRCNTKFMRLPCYVSIPNPIRIGNIFEPQPHEKTIIFIIGSPKKPLLM